MDKVGYHNNGGVSSSRIRSRGGGDDGNGGLEFGSINYFNYGDSETDYSDDNQESDGGGSDSSDDEYTHGVGGGGSKESIAWKLVSEKSKYGGRSGGGYKNMSLADRIAMEARDAEEEEEGVDEEEINELISNAEKAQHEQKQQQQQRRVGGSDVGVGGGATRDTTSNRGGIDDGASEYSFDDLEDSSDGDGGLENIYDFAEDPFYDPDEDKLNDKWVQARFANMNIKKSSNDENDSCESDDGDDDEVGANNRNTDANINGCTISNDNTTATTAAADASLNHTSSHSTVNTNGDLMSDTSGNLPCANDTKIKKAKKVKKKANMDQSNSTSISLSCPCCFTAVCYQCQQHEKFENQYRAVYAVNCILDRSQALQVEADGAAKDEHKSTGNSSTDKSSVKGGQEVETLVPVQCANCGTDIGVQSAETEIFEFFHVIPSSSN